MAVTDDSWKRFKDPVGWADPIGWRTSMDEEVETPAQRYLRERDESKEI